MLAILDLGINNLTSVRVAVRKASGHEPLTVSCGDDPTLRTTSGLILPGNGTFAAGVNALVNRGLLDWLSQWIADDRPTLGICLGMQLLTLGSAEAPECHGLGLFDIRCERLDERFDRVPHVGWSPVSWSETDDPLLVGLRSGTDFYFLHSYAVLETQHALASTPFGRAPFGAILGRSRIYGVQFHPEKSAGAGARLLANFSQLCQ